MRSRLREGIDAYGSETAMPVGEPLLRYMNRLSDLFFAMARRANHERGHPDVPWTPKPVK